MEILATVCDAPVLFPNKGELSFQVYQKNWSVTECKSDAKHATEASPPEAVNVWSGNKDAIDEIPLKKDEDPYLVLDVGDIVRKYKVWKRLLPRVEIFYAVKCNSDPVVLHLLATLGIGFDCASKKEIDTILEHGVQPSRIIYANPCKSRAYLQHAAKVGVNLMTFDNATELHKIKKEFSHAKLIIRIKVDDATSAVNFGKKFGCEIEEVPSLLQAAKDLSLDVIGVSFHVGTDAQNPSIFKSAITLCRQAFNIAEQYGYSFKILDIGGGFPGKKESSSHFAKITCVINETLEELFPQRNDIKVIAEPGQYLVESSFTLYASVIGWRETMYRNGKKMAKKYEYFLNEGVYGPFQSVISHGLEFPPARINESSSPHLYESTLWGPTWDNKDKISDKCMLPKLEVGDRVSFCNMGAYSISASFTPTGSRKASIKYPDPQKIL